MFTMRHEVVPDVEDLLRGEALAIVAAMITRLEHFSPKHRYIPVGTPGATKKEAQLIVPIGPCLLHDGKCTWTNFAGLLR